MSRITLTQDIDACHALRRAVFIDEQHVPEEIEMDDLDGVALHLLAVAQSRPVGTARIVVDPPSAKIGRICVLPAYRGLGIGRDLVRFALDHLRARGDVDTAALSAQTHALDFYERLGFAATGPIYDDAGIPHRLMRLAL